MSFSLYGDGTTAGAAVHATSGIRCDRLGSPGHLLLQPHTVLIISHFLTFSANVIAAWAGLVEGRVTKGMPGKSTKRWQRWPAVLPFRATSRIDGFARTKPAISLGRGLRIRLSALPSLVQLRITSQSATFFAARRRVRSGYGRTAGMLKSSSITAQNRFLGFP